MKNNRADASRELYRGSFKIANMVACLAGIIALAVLLQMAGYLPDEMSAVRIMLCAVMVSGLTFATMMWIPARAIKKSRTLDEADTDTEPEAEAAVPTRSPV